MKTPGKAIPDSSVAWNKPFMVVVPGNPIPLERHRSGHHSYLPPRSKAYRDLLQIHFVRAMRQHGLSVTDKPVRLEVEFYRADQRRVDIDNMCKAIMDATDHILDNDTQVFFLHAAKFYDKKNPRIILKITEV